MQDAKPDSAVHLTGADGSGITGVIRLDGRSGGATKVIATSVNVPYLTRYLSQILRRPVVDKTGLTGICDFTLDFVPDAGASPVSSPTDDNTLPPDPGVGGASIFHRHSTAARTETRTRQRSRGNACNRSRRKTIRKLV